MTVNCLPLLYKRRRQSPGRGGMTDSNSLAFSAFAYDIGTLASINP
jgi:hypothetical protein